MAERKVTYTTAAERAAIAADAIALGERVLHDDHYYRTAINEDGDEVQLLDHGELTLAPDEPAPPPPPNPFRTKYLLAETLADKLAVIARMLGLEG